ncbi:MAG: hypothetical protein B0A82_14935 [Alkalinema sp. CACIAM 70d]|nr:MAG: hypothetical protein B0A82_14935 [Alkalinema sp. CACIAM 70d]
MSIAINPAIQQKPLSFEEFLARYGSDNHYELIDGEVFDLDPQDCTKKLQPSSQRRSVSRSTMQVYLGSSFSGDCCAPITAGMTAFRPDIAAIDRSELPKEPLWSEQSILTLDTSIKFVAEVVRSNWQNDYARKLEDYAALGILEYWIADYAGLGGTRHIGKPKQPTLSVCKLVDGDYEIQQFRGNQAVVSSIFSGLKLSAEQVLRAGR